MTPEAAKGRGMISSTGRLFSNTPDKTRQPSYPLITPETGLEEVPPNEADRERIKRVITALPDKNPRPSPDKSNPSNQ